MKMVAAAPKTTSTTLSWVLGLVGASTAIAMLAACDPPPAALGNAYLILLSGAFFAGVAGVMAAVWVADDPRGRCTAGKKLIAISVASGSAAASKTWTALWVLGLVTASTAITLLAMCEPPPVIGSAYMLLLSGAFFAGLAGVMAAVWVADNPRGRRAAGKKLIAISVAPVSAAASKTWTALWVLGLVTASTAITMLVVSETPLATLGDAYLFLLSGVFFVGVAGVMAAVWVVDDPRRSLAAGRMLVFVCVAPLAAAVVGLFTALVS